MGKERTCADSGPHWKCLWRDLAGMSRKVWMEAGNVSEPESQLRTELHSQDLWVRMLF